MASINLAVQQHAYQTATPTGHMVFYCISPLATYRKDSGPAAPSIITPYTTNAYQPRMNWDREQLGKKMHNVAQSVGTQEGKFKSSGQ